MPDLPPPPNLPTEAPDAPRRVIAERYEVVSVIGQGSAARTLLCSDLREDRRVVVKELHFAHLTDWKYLELFEREAKLLGRLEHPGIPRVFDYFQGEGGPATCYIVQEYIEAPSLLQRMESGPMLGQQEIHEIAVGLLDVLAYLRGRAPPVIHRDIKPSNVLLRANGTPVLESPGDRIEEEDDRRRIRIRVHAGPSCHRCLPEVPPLTCGAAEASLPETSPTGA